MEKNWTDYANMGKNRPLDYCAKKGVAGEFKLMRLHDIPTDTELLDNSERASEFLKTTITKSQRYDTEKETFTVLFLNTRKRIIGFEIISNGTMDTLLVHPREVFRAAIMAGAHSIIVSHNHPSGDPTPSDADIRVTRDLIRAGQLLKMELMDHIIIGAPSANREKDYVSLREIGHFYA